MTNLISIGLANPAYRHRQTDILRFMQDVYALDGPERRKLKFLYDHAGIDFRYSVIPDYSSPVAEWKFYPQTESMEPFPGLELRMAWYQRYAAALSMDAIRKCLASGRQEAADITHLITVSCTGMSAPGLDLELMELLDLPRHLNRTSINFMGCYAAVHALKQAHAICSSDAGAKVLIVCTELCTLHFQKAETADNIAASLLFGDGAAAVLLKAGGIQKGVAIKDFYSEVVPKGKKDMAWELSSTGFLMTLSGYIPELVGTDFAPLMKRALERYGLTQDEVRHWCVHPGGKRILQAVEKSLNLDPGALQAGYQVLQDYGNMSSPTLLFVLKKLLDAGLQGPLVAAAFGPGLTMETCWMEAGNG